MNQSINESINEYMTDTHTKLSYKSSCLNVRFVAIGTLHVGHSFLQVLKLFLMQDPQNRCPQSGTTCVSSIMERHIGHSMSMMMDSSFSMISDGDAVNFFLDNSSPPPLWSERYNAVVAIADDFVVAGNCSDDMMTDTMFGWF